LEGFSASSSTALDCGESKPLERITAAHDSWVRKISGAMSPIVVLQPAHSNLRRTKPLYLIFHILSTSELLQDMQNVEIHFLTRIYYKDVIFSYPATLHAFKREARIAYNYPTHDCFLRQSTEPYKTTSARSWIAS
jgi:hypothetical protein